MNAAATTADVRQHILDTAKPIMLCKGFTGVGLNEILAAAGVPKGSFYHYFGSKEAFGEAILESYFADYLAHLDALLVRGSGPAADRLMRYWGQWQQMQAGNDPEGKCLVVKLGAEVCDLSEAMRVALERGTSQIVARLAACIAAAFEDGSLKVDLDPRQTAAMLYELWVGATLIEKIWRSGEPLAIAMATTRRILGLPGAH
ncbi:MULTISPECIES: TetR/AcrR family transcriptional regulator [Burkholderia]|uniref:TetR family transcriptional regulator n=1 Tax=Burkholderia savannae TaxID=1637837 RepID=A0ABR5T5S5_9BURK|nr:MULTISPECIES: TetR/AcrR family transcriptional regulator [Burkholderia]KGS02476.1 bacterial regulatory s, tetR family protein [Burkholderia sp. ABCPW 111]KWZ38571.1 TetR family transcriptional regulator [Burkholderia savannae]